MQCLRAMFTCNVYIQYLRDVGMETNLAASLGATVTMSSVYGSCFVAAKAIDGNPKDVTGQRLVNTDCAATRESVYLLLRVDLQKNILCHVLELCFIPVEVKMCMLMLVTA